MGLLGRGGELEQLESLGNYTCWEFELGKLHIKWLQVGEITRSTT